jgi:hypothetical protein
VSTYLELIQAAPALDLLLNGKGQKIVGVSGYAANRPVSEEELAPNRRIDLRILMEVSHEAALQEIQGQLRTISENQ